MNEGMRVTLRLPNDAHDRIVSAAKASGRSMNSEIITRLSGDTETLRDKFAMAALTGLLSNEQLTAIFTHSEEMPRIAFTVADACMKARANG